MMTARLEKAQLGHWVSVLLLLGLVAAACDTSVEPFTRPEQPFSIMGVLEAGQDTQFVRVTAVDDSTAFGAPPEPLRAVVTTEHLASGRITTWHDSLFQVRQVREEGVEETRWVHNVWTTADFEPTERYRFTVTGPDGRSSTATVTVPDTSADIEVIPPGTFPIWSIRVLEVDRVAEVVIELREQFDSGRIRTVDFSVVADTVPQGADGYAITVNVSQVRDRLRGGVAAVGSLRVSIAGPDWPAISGIDPDSLLQPGVISNVENGYGYLGGVATKTTLFCGPDAIVGC